MKNTLVPMHQNNLDDEKYFGTNACVTHITYGHVDPLKCVLENMCFIYWVLFGTQRELFGIDGGREGDKSGGTLAPICETETDQYLLEMMQKPDNR
jgi:hypothetical protein